MSYDLRSDEDVITDNSYISDEVSDVDISDDEENKSTIKGKKKNIKQKRFH